MNGKIIQNEPSGYSSSTSQPNLQWREADRCDTACPPSKPEKPCKTPRENNSKETYFFLSTSRDEHHAGSFSKLTWVLLGLTSLLLLGSMLGNLLLAWSVTNAARNNSNSKEVVTTTTTKEIIRVNDGYKQVHDEYYYYAPAARW